MEVKSAAASNNFLKQTVHIQSEEARNQTINRFCLLIALTSFPYIFIFIYLKIYLLSGISTSVVILFSFFIYLNKKAHYKFARTAVIIATNVEVFIFSTALGFDSGIYLYLFAAPLLVYLLFDFNQRKTILFYLFTYILTFLIIYFNQRIDFMPPFIIESGVQKAIYAFNFCCTFFMCFMLVLYFANNNHNYILNLTMNKNLLQKSLQDRELLLSEIHHRVKNNLAVVSALLELQTSYVEDEKVKNVIIESKNRIKSIALLHEKLYENKLLGEIDVKEYINELINYIKQTFNYKNKNIEFDLNIDSIKLNIDDAMPLSLIINELITNSYKHAFTNQDNGKINISILPKGNRMHFSYADNGQGIQTENKENINQFGMTLIEALAHQLDATYVIEKIDEGFSFKMQVKVNNEVSAT